MVDISNADIKKILIIDLAFIGDVILATPVVRALKKRFAGAEITFMATPLTAPVAEMNPYVDKVLIYDKQGAHAGLPGMWDVAGMIRKESFDLAVCMNFALRGAVVSWLARIPYRLGYDAQHAGWFLTWAQSHIRDGIKHETKNHAEILRPLGIDVEDFSLELAVPQKAVDSLSEKIRKWNLPEEYFALCPCGSYDRKNLPIPLAAMLIRKLQPRFPVYLIGGKKEEVFLKGLAQAGKVPESQVLAGDFNLQELAAFIGGAQHMITVDTGPMHIAQAMGTPTVAVFGPTDPAIWGPTNSNSSVVYLGCECSPCWGRGECKRYVCMDKIKAEDILRNMA